MPADECKDVGMQGYTYFLLSSVLALRLVYNLFSHLQLHT